MRCAIVASGTRKALAISAVVSPPTARRVSASCDGGETAGWQQSTSRSRVSSVAGDRGVVRGFEVEDRALPAATGALAAPGIHQPATRDRDEPRARIVGDALLRPLLRRRDAAPPARRPRTPRTARAGARACRAPAAPARGGAPRSALGAGIRPLAVLRRAARTSTTPDHFTMRPTISRRRSSDSTSTIQKPMSDSFDSAYGPSVTATGPPSA